ncbi:MAG: CBS domain-containing protein [Bdellovibrionales bacterium]|nr:CBS domain-containing protein [Bdellovibrionales bacterium]
MKAIPQIQKYMTFVPKSIGADQPISKAQEFMKKLHLRHLPVLRGGKLVGVITERDINFILQFAETNAETLTVEDAYTADPYHTTPTAPLNEVVSHMAEKKYGCALVVDNGKLVGIFTEIDAYNALSDLLETRLKN